jgi:hypothetical protein
VAAEGTRWELVVAVQKRRDSRSLLDEQILESYIEHEETGNATSDREVKNNNSFSIQFNSIDHARLRACFCSASLRPGDFCRAAPRRFAMDRKRRGRRPSSEKHKQPPTSIHIPRSTFHHHIIRQPPAITCSGHRLRPAPPLPSSAVPILPLPASTSSLYTSQANKDSPTTLLHPKDRRYPELQMPCGTAPASSNTS